MQAAARAVELALEYRTELANVREAREAICLTTDARGSKIQPASWRRISEKAAVRHMTIKSLRWLLSLALIGVWSADSSAVELFSDNFNADTSGNWTTNVAPAGNEPNQQATFAFDYRAMGIPPAPSSSDTLGLRLRANIPGGAENPVTTRPPGVLSGLSLSPTGKDFGTNYQLSFDAWSNFCGAPNAAGLADNGDSEGGTYNVMFAIGTSGTVPLVVGNTALVSGGAMDGVGFATTGDGGITNDYRVYPASGTFVPAATAGVYAAGSTANTNAFYATPFPAQMAPAVQQSISTNEYGGDAANTQAGSTQAGEFGFAWHKVVITKLDNIVTWDVDEERIATFDASALALGGNNIGIGLSDVNTTTARHPSLVFTVFDNLVVTDNSSGQPGDFTGNGIVDAMDLQQWQGDFGLNDESDADGDDDSDGADFLIWQQNLGTPGQTAAAAAVPEPASSLLALSVILSAVAVRRRCC